MTTQSPTHEEKISKLNAELNGHRHQEGNLPPGETVETLIAKEDQKVDISKIKLFKDVPSDAPDQPKEGQPALVDPDAPGAKEIAPPPAALKTPAEKSLKERASEHEKLAARQAAKFRNDRAAKDEAAAATARAVKAEAEAARLLEQNTRTVSLLEEATKSPEAALAFVAKAGVNAITLAKTAVAQGKTPEQVATSAVNEELRLLREERAALKADKEAKEKEERAKQESAAKVAKYEADKLTFIERFKEGGTEKYPTLTQYVDSPEEIVDAFIGFVNTLRANPKTAAELEKNAAQYSDAVLLALFERVTAKKVGKFLNKDSSSGNKTAELGKTPGDKAGTKIAKKTSNGKRQALPANFDKLSDSEQNRLMAEWTEKYAIKTE